MTSNFPLSLYSADSLKSISLLTSLHNSLALISNPSSLRSRYSLHCRNDVYSQSSTPNLLNSFHSWPVWQSSSGCFFYQHLVCKHHICYPSQWRPSSHRRSERSILQSKLSDCCCWELCRVSLLPTDSFCGTILLLNTMCTAK
jgi:hypothetical protein